MPPAAERLQIISTFGICVPEVEKSSANRLAPAIENKT